MDWLGGKKVYKFTEYALFRWRHAERWFAIKDHAVLHSEILSPVSLGSKIFHLQLMHILQQRYVFRFVTNTVKYFDNESDARNSWNVTSVIEGLLSVAGC